VKIIPTQQLIDIIIKAEDKASTVADKVDKNIKKIGESTNLLGRVPGFNALSGKINQVSSTISGRFNTAVDKAKMKMAQLSKTGTSFGKILGPLKGALSMTVGMIGYDLVNGMMSAAKESLNAASQLDYFGQRLNMSASESAKFRADLDSLQKDFRKVDMTAVGASAEEMAVKFKLPKESLTDLTKMTTVLSSTFVKEGRTQEDAILAVGDALDGQFKRLQEIGITQQTLKDNGWNGNLEDQAGLIDAINAAMEDMGYEQTAKDITNLDEAMGALNIAGGQLLQKVLVPLTPVIIGIVDALLKFADGIGDVIDAIGGMPDWAKIALGVTALGLAISGVSTAIAIGLIPSLGTLLAPLTAAATAAWAFAAALLANPLTWVAVALAAVAVAVYEVGKYFGWWTDIGSMLDAIWAGIQRLWSAFINHPDVQSFIQGMKDAWAALQPYIQRVVSWVQSFFTNTSGAKFDFVRALIDALGQAWNALTLPIRTVIKVVKLVISTMQKWYLTTLARINMIKALFTALPGKIKGAISGLVNVITKPFKDAYTKITGVVGDIKSAANGLKNGISIGGIKDKLTKPFKDAWSSISKYIQKIKDGANNIPVVGGMFGGTDLAYGGTDLIPETTAKVVGTDTITVNNKQDINLSLDLRNVPAGIDEATLYNVVIETLSDRNVIGALVNNNDFQVMDSKAKQRILARNNRARGV